MTVLREGKLEGSISPNTVNMQPLDRAMAWKKLTTRKINGANKCILYSLSKFLRLIRPQSSSIIM